MESRDWRHKLLPVFALATLPLAVGARGGDVVPPGADEGGCVVSVRDSVEGGARATADGERVVSARASVADGATAAVEDEVLRAAGRTAFGGVTGGVAVEGTADVPPGWLELPAYSVTGMRGTTPSTLGDLYQVTHWAVEDSVACRNYTLLYDPEMYASYWVAYPLYADRASGTGRYENWAFDPDVPQSKQTDLTHGAYGVRFASDNYAKNYYARGHQIANADRNGDRPMCEQTYYMTNLTPQIQNGFNGGIWAHLESAVRSLVSADTNASAAESASVRPVPKNAAASESASARPVPKKAAAAGVKPNSTSAAASGAKSTAANASVADAGTAGAEICGQDSCRALCGCACAGQADAISSDTVYVVTGAAFRKRTDGTEAINSIVNARDGKTLPVPNYYWKALLKVKWGVAGCAEAEAGAVAYAAADDTGNAADTIRAVGKGDDIAYGHVPGCRCLAACLDTSNVVLSRLEGKGNANVAPAGCKCPGKRVIAEAMAVGFWLPHRDLKGASWADFTVSVDQIEEWTGLDMFANLPDSLQTAAEANASWLAFASF